MAKTVEAVCNQALDAIGYQRHITSVWDGTRAARIALNAWGDTRDTLFMAMRPDFAIWDDPLVPSKTAPPYYDDVRVWTPTTDPDLPWKYEYQLPANCLVPLVIKPRPSYLTVWRPRQSRYRIKGTIENKHVLLGDDPAPVLTCVHSVPAVPVWENDFIEAMVRVLAQKFQVGLGEGPPPKEEKADANNPG
jgi:hypothetical protein